MLDHNVLNTLLFPIFLTICWGAVLYCLVASIERLMPKVASWSRFWQLMYLIALAPLLPGLVIDQNRMSVGDLASLLGNAEHEAFAHQSASLVQVTSNAEVLGILSASVLVISIGSIGFIGQYLLGLVRIRRLISNSRPLAKEQTISCEQQCRILQMNVRVRVSEVATSPFVYGLFKTYLLLPDYFFRLSETQQYLLLEHELNHVQRKDPQSIILMRLLASVFWFNPVLRYLEAKYIQKMELACDQQVIVSHPKKRLAYAQTLITSLKLSLDCQNTMLASHFADKRAKKRLIEERLKQTMQGSSILPIDYIKKKLLVVFSIAILPMFVIAKPYLSLQLISVNTGSWQTPVSDARLTSDFGAINEFRSTKPHKGMDFAAPTGTPIFASRSGKVVIADNTSLHRNYGKVVVIEHQENIQTLYAHLDSYAVESGDYISQGQIIGSIGATGRVTGPHLHFEVIRQGERIDPKFLLGK
mgnify:CR=1 FL=1